MKITEIPAKPKEQKITRVAAYARVSSDKDAAFHSLEAQTEYYEEYVSAHKDWELVSIYSDNGISGTIINRPEFRRMLEDCRAGKIDLVITKSVTRFARNTVVLLETVRELKALGIDCYFEKENMHSISPDGELLLTLLAMYAEEEARSVSENQKWRVRKKFENGEPWVGNMLGYRLIHGKLVIIPEEAEIVRRIFNEYLDGNGTIKICRGLNQDGIVSFTGAKWRRSTVSTILHNEKYAGNMLLQKTYCGDFRTKRSKRNPGILRQYYVEGSHEPIISPEIFDAVQKEIERRKEIFAKTSSNVEKQYLFTGMIQCGICGHLYFRRITGSNNIPYRKPIWICHEFFELGKAVCTSQQIPESILIEKTKAILSVDELTRDIIAERIVRIEVPGHNVLKYVLKDGSQTEIHWKHRSRSESWTPEMRQAAREKALELNRKRKEDADAKSNDN